MSLQPNKLCLVIPCYNEESILQDTVQQLLALLHNLEEEDLISKDSCMLLVNDGSSDKTWEIIENASKEYPGKVLGASLAANRGHQAALLAGLTEASDISDVTVSLDADLQDDINVIQDFLREYHNGNDIVYGVRNDRSSDSFFKRITAESFYKLMQWLGVKTIYNHADFRLIGLVPILGFRQAIVFYKRKPADRPTHYPLSKMLLLAWEGITSFSIRPIRAITFLGVIMMAICFLLLLYILYSKFVGFTVAGWTSLAAVTLLLGSFQLLSVGIIGEYNHWRIYRQNLLGSQTAPAFSYPKKDWI